MNPPPEIFQLITRFERNIDSYRSQAYKLVYDLFGLTPEEIKIVEETTA